MNDLFRNKYRIPSARLQTWDYGWNGAYFITICTKGRECFLGNIVNGIMHLSGAGIIAHILWYEIKNHATDIELGEFVVMPNHIHGIIVLNGWRGDAGDEHNGHVETGFAVDLETGHDLSLPHPEPQPESRPELSREQPQPPPKSLPQPLLTPGQKRFRNQGKNTVSSIMGGYKSAVTKHANRLKIDFGWQVRFHDHIIRDEREFNTISNYIINNVANWGGDKFFRPDTPPDIVPPDI